MPGSTVSLHLKIRGRVIATYAIVLGLGSVISQLVFVWIDVETDDLILLFAILMNMSVVLVAMNRSSVPKIDRKPARKFKPLVINVLHSESDGVCGRVCYNQPYHAGAILSVGSRCTFIHGCGCCDGDLPRPPGIPWPIGIISDRIDRRNYSGRIGSYSNCAPFEHGICGPRRSRMMSGAHGVLWQWFAFATGILLGATGVSDVFSGVVPGLRSRRQ